MKTKVRAFCAVFALVSGFILSAIALFLPPVGVISDSVLMYTGEAFFFAGSALGLDVMIDHKISHSNKNQSPQSD